MSEKKRGLPKPPLFTSDYIAMAEILEFALDRFGQLVLALMRYTADGTELDDLPPDIKAMFSIYRRKIDAAREKYDHVCAVRAESGSKGGKAKAEKSKQSAEKFKPPTLKQFREAAEHFEIIGDIEDIDCFEVDGFYDHLRKNNWTIGGEPIKSRNDWETAIQAKFFRPAMKIPSTLYYKAFEQIFAS